MRKQNASMLWQPVFFSLGRAFSHRERKWRWPCGEEGETGWYGRVGKKARRAAPMSRPIPL